MRGYDDGPTIKRIQEAMAASPGMSRRAAIIAEAGEDNLRRIERKMQLAQQDESTWTMPTDLLRYLYGAGSFSTVRGRILTIDTLDGHHDVRISIAMAGGDISTVLLGRSLRPGANVVCTFTAGGHLVMVHDERTGAVAMLPTGSAALSEISLMSSAVLAFMVYVLIAIMAGPVAAWTGTGMTVLGLLYHPVKSILMHRRRRHLVETGLSKASAEVEGARSVAVS